MVDFRHAFAGAGVLLAFCVLTGCSAPGVTQAVRPGIPDGLDDEQLGDVPVVTWVERGESFAIVTWGSSSCPAVATAVSAESDDSIAVTFGPSPNDPCTADMAPTTHEFGLPDEVTLRPITINVSYETWAETYSLTLD